MDSLTYRMLRRFILTLICASLAVPSFSQKIDCSDFKTGSFILPKTEVIPVSFKIIRNATEQIEEVIDVPDSLIDYFPKGRHFGTIRWVNDCSYILHYDSSKMSLDETMTKINKSGGLEVEIFKVDGSCANYRASSNIDGEKFTIQAKICKVSD